MKPPKNGSPHPTSLSVVCSNCCQVFGNHYGGSEDGWECPDVSLGAFGAYPKRPVPHGRVGYFIDPYDHKLPPPPKDTIVGVIYYPVNDHVCPTCNNERCSKQEKTCWKCGSNLHDHR